MEQNANASKKLIGKVTDEERSTIKLLYEKKNGLVELAKCLNETNMQLYDRVATDLGSVTIDFNNWWSQKSEKYQWENILGYQWEIQFETGEIFLVRQPS